MHCFVSLQCIGLFKFYVDEDLIIAPVSACTCVPLFEVSGCISALSAHVGPVAIESYVSDYSNDFP